MAGPRGRGALYVQLFGGYSPLRRAYRRLRPSWMAELTPAGRQIGIFVARWGLTVLHGPFSGMEYPKRARGHANFLAAKLLGSYELELHEVIEQMITAAPGQIVDVGAAEGYYAVGLAMRTTDQTRVEVFETDASGRRQCAEMAQLNGVADRLSLRGSCDVTRLGAILTERAFVVCDCEGCEFELLRPEAVPQLRTATIVAELHPFVHADIEEVMQRRFSQTHDIRILRVRTRDPSSWSELTGWSDDAAFLILSEGAPSPDLLAEFERLWAYLVPRLTFETVE